MPDNYHQNSFPERSDHSVSSAEAPNTAYPFDRPEGRPAYPCDTPGDGPLYPCDVPGEKAAYPCDVPETTAGDETPAVRGKGRRGGNASASKVIHSGNFRTGKPNRGPGRDQNDSGRAFKAPYHDAGLRSDREAGFAGRKAPEAAGRRTDDRPYRASGRNEDRSGGFDDRRPRGMEKRSASDRDRRSFRTAEGHGTREQHFPDMETALNQSYRTTVVKTSEVGAFVEVPERLVRAVPSLPVPESGLALLPFAEQLGRPESGTEVEVFFYEDKGGRLTATMRSPILKNGEIGILTVAAVTKIGAFLDNGVPKQVLLPFKEQLHTPEVGDDVLVWLYTDKTGRQAASMRVYTHLDKNSPYKEDDRVTGFVYEVNPRLGVFVAVDNRYYGLVPIRETFRKYEYGDEVEARVARVRDDGKLDLLIRDKLYKTVQEDAEVILYELRRNNGFLPYGDRADAAFIEETYAMSKNQFKRALGHLYRNRVVELDRSADTVRLL